MASPIPTQLSPGVKVSEIDLSLFVQPESFTRGGMAGVFNWGPGLVATTVSSESQLATIFGNPTLDQFDTEGNGDFLAAANFLRYGNNLRVVRALQSEDYNAVSVEPGITWINSVDYKTVKNEDEFRNFGGFSGSDGIESKSYFKARYPGNFGNALAVVVYDGVTSETVQSTVNGFGLSDFTLSGGYSNPSTMPGISYGTMGITLISTYVSLEVVDIDPDTGEEILAPVENFPASGRTFAQVNWVMLTFDVPNEFANGREFINFYRNEVIGVPNGKFLYAKGTTSANRTATWNGTNPDGNNGNVIPLRANFDSTNAVEANPLHIYGIAFNNGNGNPVIDDFMVQDASDDRKVHMLFWEFDGSNFALGRRPGDLFDFGGAIGLKTVWAFKPHNIGQTPSGNIPTPFFGVAFPVSTVSGVSIFHPTKNTADMSVPAALKGFDAGNRLVRYLDTWGNVSAIMNAAIPPNGKGWVNLIGGLTGPRQLRTFENGVIGSETINFDPTSGITGIRNNFANGIVQLGRAVNVQTVETNLSYDSYRLFDKNPSTSEYAASVGGSNDEISIAVVDAAGKFGPRGGILEKFELLSKAVDAKSLDGTPIYYKDYINNNSKFVYLTKPFGFTGGGTATSTATTAFGDIYTPYTIGGITYNRTGFYDAYFDFGASTVGAATDGEMLTAYSLFADDDNAVDVLFVPESSVADDTSGDNTSLEQSIYNTVIDRRKDTVFVIPTPKPASADQYSSFAANNAIQFRKNNLSIPNNSYTILVAGRKLFFDSYNNQIRRMSLASDIAGILCAQEIPWESPAGFARGMMKNSIRLEKKFSKVDRDELYKNQVNFFVESGDGSGTVLFGDKTLLVKPSVFDRINVRRVFIALEKSISKAAKFSLFEFNDEFTRAQFRNLVTPFLRNVQAQRGITDFKVVCDETNNTPDVIDRNQFVADIYIKPNKSVNFVQLNFIAVKSDFNLSTIE